MTAPALAHRPGEPAAADGPVLSLLRLAAGGETLAVPIDRVREILKLRPMTPLPRTPAFVRGVMNLRGAVVPVIDLAARLGREPITVGRRSCIVVVDVEDTEPGTDAAAPEAAAPAARLVAGLLVDAVFEVFDTPAAAVEAVPPLGTRVSAAHLAGMARARGQVIGLLALPRVLSPRGLGLAIAEHDAALREPA